MRLLVIAAAILVAFAVPASAQTAGPTIGIASVIGGGEQETNWTWQNAEDCGGGIEHNRGELAQFAPAGAAPSVAITATAGHVRVSPVALYPFNVTLDRAYYYGPERLSNCDSPSAEEDCGIKATTAELSILPTPDGMEVRSVGPPGYGRDPFTSCYRPAGTVGFPEIVPARAPIAPAALTVGAFDLPIELHGGPVAFSLPAGSGTTASVFRFRLIGGVAPLLSLEGAKDTRTLTARRGAVGVPLECSKAGRCKATLALRPAGASASLTIGEPTAIPRPAKARTMRDVGRRKAKLRAGRRTTVALKVGRRRGRFDLVVSQFSAGWTVNYVAARIRVR